MYEILTYFVLRHEFVVIHESERTAGRELERYCLLSTWERVSLIEALDNH